MKSIFVAASIAGGLLLTASAQAAGSVTAADLSARCTANRAVCENTVKWIQDNTGACILADQKQDEIVNKVMRWLKNHPAQTGTDDNDVTGYAVSALWPCR